MTSRLEDMQNVRAMMVNYDGWSNKKISEFCFKNFMTINNMNLLSKLIPVFYTGVTSTFLRDRTGFTWEFITILY